MPMKYKVLLCVLALLAFSAAAFAADVTVYSENFDGATVPAYGLQGNWAIGVPAKAGVAGPSAAVSGTKVLAYNLTGGYPPNISPAQYATTPPIDCSGKVGVRLSFQRWLRVEDSFFDKATVEVSKDGTTWTTIWTNPTQGKGSDSTMDLLDSSWNLVSFDISSVADNQSKVFVRWGLSSNSTHEFAGWSIDDVKVVATGNDVLFQILPTGAALPAGMTASDPAIWQLGGAAAGGGQLQDTDGNPATPPVLVGADPAANSAGAPGGGVIGTVIGGNYPAGMLTPAYLTWGPLDLTGRTGVKLEFQRWLEVEDSKFDRVRIEAANTLDAVQVSKDTSAVTLDKTTKSKVYAVNTTGFFTNVATVKYVASNLAVGESVKIQYTLNNSAGTPTWVTLTTDTANTPKDTVVTFTSPVLDVLASDNPNFAVRVLLTTASDTSTAKVAISEVSVKGVLWTVVFQNPTAGTVGTTNVFDTAWTAVSYNLAAVADNQKTVYVRWSVGPTDEFPNSNYGGWSLDDIRITAGSRQWSFVSETAPSALLWGATGDVSVVAKNTGTATWDKTFKLYNVEGVKSTVPDPANPGKSLNIVDFKAMASPTGILDRWGVPTAGIPVSGTVAPDATATFKATVKAPNLTSVVYDLSKPISAPASEASALSLDFNMASPTPALAIDWLPRYLGGSIANAGVITSRFGDVLPSTAGFWARYFIEELAGRSPMIVQGFTPTEYRPSVVITRDQIAVFMARARGLDQSNPTGTVFHDVPRDYWAAGAIEAAAKAGIVNGFPDLSYQPTLPITRDAMAKFIANGAQVPAFPAPTSMSAAGWFSDVQVVDDPNTTADDRNVFRDFISALQHADIVQGFADDPNHPTYRPALQVTRDQLAVYVWRAFMRDKASVVVLGGPGITAVNVPTAQYSGFVNAPSLVQQGDQFFAYVTLDAMRLAGANLAGLLGDGNLDVTFTLAEANGVSAANVSQTVSVPLATVQGWVANVTGGAGATGEPYVNVAWQIPTGLQGQFKLQVSIEGGAALATQQAFSVMASMFTDTFDTTDDLLNWTLFGQPGTGAKIYPLYLADPTKGDTNLFKGTGSLELQGTQQVVRQFSTANRNDIRLLVSLAAVGLGSSDAVKVEWSKNFGTKGASADWTAVYNQAGSAVPSKLTQVSFDLPNGDPKADPPTIGANNNPDFAVRLSITATAAAARAYFDNLEIRGD